MRRVFLRIEDHLRGHIVVSFLALVMAALDRRLRAQDSAGRYQKVVANFDADSAVRSSRQGLAMVERATGTVYNTFWAVGLRLQEAVGPVPQLGHSYGRFPGTMERLFPPLYGRWGWGRTCVRGCT